MAAIVEIRVDFKRTGESPKAVADDVRDVGRAANDASGGFSVLGGAAAAALGGIAAQAGIAAAGMVANFASSSVDIAGQFEGNMNLFAAAAGGALEEAGLSVADFEAQFLELGTALPVSTLEVQEAAIAMIKGGIDPASVAAGGLESTLLFAAAAGMSLENAADLTAKQLGTFVSITATAAERSEFMAMSQDLITKAANASTLNVESLGEAMLAAGGQARAIGLDYEDFVTSMGLISPAFGSAAEAGTSFKNFLVRLNPSTDAAKDAMQALGLATEDGATVFFDAQGQFLGVENAAEHLQNALGHLSDQERVMALQTIFGNDAMGAAAALADGGSEAYQAFAESMANANGVAAQGAAVQQGFDFAMEQLSGTIEVVQIKLGTALLPTLEYFVGLTANVIGALMGSSDAFALLPGPIQSFVAAIMTGVSYVQDFISNFNGISSAVDEISGQSESWGEQLTRWVGIAAALIGPALENFIVSVVSWITTNAPIIAANMVAWGTQMYQWISDAMPIVLANLGIVIENVKAWLSANLPVLVEGLAAWGKELFEWILDALPGLLANLMVIAANIQIWLIANLPPIVAQLAEWALAFTAWVLTDAAPKLIVALGELFGQFLAWMIERFPVIVTAIAEWIPAITNWVKDAIPVLLENLGTFATDLLGHITGMVEDVTKEGDTVGAAIIDGIVAGVTAGVGALKGAVESAAADALAAAKAFLGIQSPSAVFAASVGVPVMDGFAKGIKDQSGVAVTAIQDAVQATITAGEAAVVESPLTPTFGIGTEAFIEPSTPLNPVFGIGENTGQFEGVGATSPLQQLVSSITQNINYAPSYLSGGGGMADVGMLRTLARGI